MRSSRCSGLLASPEFRLELPGPGFGLNAGFLLGVGAVLLSFGSGFGLNAGFLFGVGAVPLVSEPGYVPSGGRVVPAESGILPPEVQVQDRAVALVSPVVNPFNGDGLVGAVNQPVPGQGSAVVPAPGVVKAPVFRDAQGGVAIPLYGDVPASGAGRGDFQDEVRGLALLRGDVAVAVAARFWVDVEGDEQVRWEKIPEQAGCGNVERSSPDHGNWLGLLVYATGRGS